MKICGHDSLLRGFPREQKNLPNLNSWAHPPITSRIDCQLLLPVHLTISISPSFPLIIHTQKSEPHKPNQTHQSLHHIFCNKPIYPLYKHRSLLCQVFSHHAQKQTSSKTLRVFSAMATVTSQAISIPTFTGLKANKLMTTSSAKIGQPASPSNRLAGPIKASLKDFGVAVAATAASAMLVGNAMAVEVLLGGDDGSLAFIPGAFSVKAGEKIIFKNNAGFPHNVVFDEDEIPAGVDAGKISMPEEELLNGPGETYSVSLTEKGTYSFYCSPHQGAGMVGKVTVE